MIRNRICSFALAAIAAAASCVPPAMASVITKLRSTEVPGRHS